MLDQTPEAPASAGGQPDFTRRRTFAIISHPDAGKTTLTEKLLLASGAIRQAGQVKARGERRRTRSDWMEIEQQRGISVTSSVMTFERDGIVFNLLDTPGHSDFSEDTYRTLSAVDAAVMVIDVAKGIESQTRKLFEVCRLRDIPIFTFINKVDREGQDPLGLMDDIAATLALDLTPFTWPIGLGTDFRGLIDVPGKRALLAEERGGPLTRIVPYEDPIDLLGLEGVEARIVEEAVESLSLALGVLPPFELESFREGHLSPVFYGSAIKEAGVAQLLAGLGGFGPSPLPRNANGRTVEPAEANVSGFVFKVQANMDPNHRDRVAFVRLCSGVFKRGMKLFNAREKRHMAIANPIFFFAQERETVDEAVAGDIIGIPNHGMLRVGDTLSEGETIRFEGIPDFAPEILRRVLLADPMKSKQLQKALHDLAEEGVTQVLRPLTDPAPIVGVVGTLQLDVLSSRLDKEYGVPIRYESVSFVTARWITGDRAEVDRFAETSRSSIALDRDDQPVYLARSQWVLDRAIEEWPKLKFVAVKERG
ncbi:peptide chain release factor 3 [Azorhizobium caulinodans ORS 571]|uniref:Peptide chain release factor 3 n=1 Tax=Azorhizobium caulinodans (strain ATCC 43989 / DSM 5975 / JCM 20966 / LMG 6465 / NBRC 14845 / NCIMB 13405 / ORS 571) TaxID=438753 RepID=A8IIX6_AZOC5|nr:peptide chain release factor 3 [Azorhizobium caulinodans]BAF86211.1 peptide chain release factor 3 [Azorhizobium caulinodans ORS 571]